MPLPTLEACPAPVELGVVPNSVDESQAVSGYEEEQDGCVILGLVSAFSIYALLGLGAVAAMRLFHLLG